MARLLGIVGVALLALFLGGGAPAYAQNASGFLPAAYSSNWDRAGKDSSNLKAIYPERGSQGASVTRAIRLAADRTGVDYDYLLAKAQIESGLDPTARAKGSTASGLFQFIESTWLASIKKHAGDLGLDRSGSRASLLSMRNDAQIAALLAAAHARENGERLRSVLGREANHTELYLAHFLGSAGAARFVRAMQRDPDAQAAALFPKAARSNRNIFFTRSGAPRSLGGVAAHFDAKLRAAIASIHGASSTENSEINVLAWSCAPRVARTDNAGDGFEVNIADQTGTLHPLLLRTSSRNFIKTSEKPCFGEASSESIVRIEGIDRFMGKACNHIEMCYSDGMSTSTITRVRDLVEQGTFTKAGLARAAGLHANTLRDATEPDWNPTAETLTKLQNFLDSNDDTPVLVGAEEIINEARNGRMYILVDDEDRENEGDLIIPAQMATPDAINFMATHGRGLICLALDKARVNHLGLQPMTRNNTESMQTAFTISIEAKEGVTTGISAADRARTVSVAIDATKGPDDIVMPGHVFPLTARDGGVLVRAGHTEAAVDISRLAGLNPSGVICEILNEDGTMARLDDLIGFARKHNLKIGTIRDLIEYRMRHDHLVERVEERDFTSDYGGQWRMAVYRNSVDGREHYVLQKGHVLPGEPTLTRVHPISIFDDVLGQPGERKRTLQRAMQAIGEHGSGVIVIITGRQATGSYSTDDEVRNVGIGSQILADLDVEDMILLSNSQPNVVAIEGYGLNIVDHMPIPG